MRVSRGPEPRCLFVYGTLRRGFPNSFARQLAEQAKWLGEASVQGRLYDLGRCPGMRPPRSANDRVTGELYELKDQSILPTLATYEGEEYERKICIARRNGRRAVKAWVFVYRWELPEAWRIPVWPTRSAAPQSD